MSKFSCILLVEDDHISSFISMKAMKQFHMYQDIHLQTDGLEAFDFLKLKAESGEQAPELILFDLGLPGLSGKKFFSQVSSLPFVNKDAVVICALTNADNMDDAEELKKLGLNEYISKPLTKNILDQIYQQYFTKEKN